MKRKQKQLDLNAFSNSAEQSCTKKISNALIDINLIINNSTNKQTIKKAFE